jgi:hypothetical protein
VTKREDIRHCQPKRNPNILIVVICDLLGNYTASCGNYLPTFRDNVSVPSSRVKIGILTREDGKMKTTDYIDIAAEA